MCNETYSYLVNYLKLPMHRTCKNKNWSPKSFYIIFLLLLYKIHNLLSTGNQYNSRDKTFKKLSYHLLRIISSYPLSRPIDV